MNSFIKKILQIILISLLFMEFIWIWKWYKSSPMGKARIIEMEQEIDKTALHIVFLKNAISQLNHQEYLWENSTCLHEYHARKNLGYSYPGEYIFMFPQ